MGVETTNQYVVATPQKIQDRKVENTGNYVENKLRSILQTRFFSFYGGCYNYVWHRCVYIYIYALKKKNTYYMRYMCIYIYILVEHAAQLISSKSEAMPSIYVFGGACRNLGATATTTAVPEWRDARWSHRIQ